MLHLRVLVPEDRERSAVLILSDGAARIREDLGAASSVLKLAAAHGNAACDPLRPWGHAPLGTYRLLRRASAPAGCDVEYGSQLLLFEAQGGPALEAESFGRLALLVYGGPAGQDRRLRRTQGGVRLSQAMMKEISARLGAGGDMSMRIEALGAPAAWWQFWKPRYAVQPQPLSADAPHFVSPPLDEASLVADLLKGARRRRPAESDRDTDADRWGRDSSSSSGSSESRPFRGGGGETAGAGAGGSWGDASAGRPAGVDAAGRIVTAAAAGIAAEAATAAALDTDSESGTPAASETGDSGTRADTSY